MTTTRNRSAAIEDEAASDLGSGQEHPLAEAGADATQTAGQLAERAADLGFQQADRTREQAAEGINQLASTTRRVSTEIESEQPTIATIASGAAEQAERLAGYLRDTDARELMHTIEDVARRQPLLFVGGAFVLGVAASRFVKAAGGGTSGSQGVRHGGTSYGGTSYGGTYGRGYEATGPGALRGADGLADATDEGLRP